MTDVLDVATGVGAGDGARGLEAWQFAPQRARDGLVVTTPLPDRLVGSVGPHASIARFGPTGRRLT